MHFKKITNENTREGGGLYTDFLGEHTGTSDNALLCRGTG